jgi:hypothetical protein
MTPDQKIFHTNPEHVFTPQQLRYLGLFATALLLILLGCQSDTSPAQATLQAQQTELHEFLKQCTQKEYTAVNFTDGSKFSFPEEVVAAANQTLSEKYGLLLENHFFQLTPYIRTSEDPSLLTSCPEIGCPNKLQVIASFYSIPEDATTKDGQSCTAIAIQQFPDLFSAPETPTPSPTLPPTPMEQTSSTTICEPIPPCGVGNAVEIIIEAIGISSSVWDINIRVINEQGEPVLTQSGATTGTPADYEGIFVSPKDQVCIDITPTMLIIPTPSFQSSESQPSHTNPFPLTPAQKRRGTNSKTMTKYQTAGTYAQTTPPNLNRFY